MNEIEIIQELKTQINRLETENTDLQKLQQDALRIIAKKNKEIDKLKQDIRNLTGGRMKKLYITIITIVALILVFSFGAYAYIQSSYKSNASDFETSYEDDISITVEIAENKKLIPYGAIISRVDETTELTVKVVVKSDIRMLYKLKHNLPASYELVGWQVWFPYEIDKENTHTFKIRLLENIQSMTSNIIFELYDIVLLEG